MRTIFLAAGHSDTDPGAVAQGRREAAIAVEFRNMVSFYLRRDGYPHATDGAGQSNLPLAQSAALARRHDIAVEFHCNAAANPAAGGVETLSGPKDMALGNLLCEVIANELGIRNRGAKPENSGQHRRLAFVQAGGIIVELFFLTSPGDLAAYEQRKWLAARAVSGVLLREARR